MTDKQWRLLCTYLFLIFMVLVALLVVQLRVAFELAPFLKRLNGH